MKEKVSNFQSVWFVGVVLVGLGVIEVVLAGFPSSWRFYVDILLFVSGGVAGYYLVDLEQLLFVFLTSPEAESSQLANKLWKENRYKEAVKTALYYKDAPDRVKLPFSNLLFMLIWPVVTFFFVFSSGSSLVAGLSLVVYWRVWLRLFTWYRADVVVFRLKAGFMIARELTEGEIKVILYVTLGLLLLFIGMGL